METFFCGSSQFRSPAKMPKRICISSLYWHSRVALQSFFTSLTTESAVTRGRQKWGLNVADTRQWRNFRFWAPPQGNQLGPPLPCPDDPAYHCNLPPQHQHFRVHANCCVKKILTRNFGPLGPRAPPHCGVTIYATDTRTNHCVVIG